MATRIMMFGLAIIIACLLEGCGRDNGEAELDKKMDELQQQINNLKKARARVRAVVSAPMLTAAPSTAVLAPVIRATATPPDDQATANTIGTANVPVYVGEPPAIVSSRGSVHYSGGSGDNNGGDNGGWYYSGYGGGWYPRDYGHHWYSGQYYGRSIVSGQCYGYRTITRTVVTKPHNPDHGCRPGNPGHPTHPGYPPGGYRPGPAHPPNGGHPMPTHPTGSTHPNGNHRR